MKPSRSLVGLILVLLSATSSALGEKIRGRVVNEQGEPVAGARCKVSGYEGPDDSIHFISGGPNEALTDAEGRFEIEVSSRYRYDLQFDHFAYAPTFLYRTTPASTDLTVTLRRGQVVRGRIVRVEPEVPDLPRRIHATVVLTLPNHRGSWYRKEIPTEASGEFECRVDIPPAPPGGGAPRWQICFAGEIVELDLASGQEPQEIVLEVQVRVRRTPRVDPPR